MMKMYICMYCIYRILHFAREKLNKEKVCVYFIYIYIRIHIFDKLFGVETNILERLNKVYI